jgi:serine/threonine protein kinase
VLKLQDTSLMATTPTSIGSSNTLAWYDVTKTYCIIGIVSRDSGILGSSQNECYITRIYHTTGLGDGYDEEEDIQSGLALTFSIESFINVTEGHCFGRNPETCDILLDEEDGDKVDEMHFRVQLDYAAKMPELDIYNCSLRGTRVGDTLLAAVGQRKRIYQGEEVKVQFPILDLNNRKMRSRWTELKTTAWSLFKPSVRQAITPKDARQRYLDAEEECIWQEVKAPNSHTLSGSTTITLAKGVQHAKTGFAIVLKRLRDQRGDATEEAINMGETAAMTTLSPSHQNIVSAFRQSWPQGNVILVEHTPHGSLADFLHHHHAKRLQEDAVMDLALQMLTALCHLNSAGLYHRDVKPTKILVFRTDPPLFKITEFGGENLADVRRYIDDRIADDTIDYVAPEVFECGSHASPLKTDVWSLGIIMWELLVGTAPVAFLESELTYMSCFRAILNWQPRVGELVEWGVSDEGQEVVMRMCERQPKFRPDVERLRRDECFDYLEFVRMNEPCE